MGDRPGDGGVAVAEGDDPADTGGLGEHRRDDPGDVPAGGAGVGGGGAGLEARHGDGAGGLVLREQARTQDRPVQVGGLQVPVGGDLGNGVGAQRVVVGHLAVGADEGDHDVAPRPRRGGGLHRADGGRAVDGVGALRPALAAGPGGPDDGVGAGQRSRELLGASVLHGQHQGAGPGGGDVVGLRGVADDGDDLVAGGHEQRGGQEGDLAVTADNDDARHAATVTRRSPARPPAYAERGTRCVVWPGSGSRDMVCPYLEGYSEGWIAPGVVEGLNPWKGRG